MQQLFYFGCIGGPGHFLHDTYGRHLSHYSKLVDGLNHNLLQAIDTTFCPGNGQDEGQYLESNVFPVKIVAWWDTSIDKRPNSNSALIGVGYATAEEMIDAAIKLYPQVMSRQPRPVRWEVPFK